MNKSIFVPAKFKPLGKIRAVKVETGKTKKRIFGGEKAVTKKEDQWVQTGVSDTEIDGEALAVDVNSVIESMNSDGFEVVSVTSVMSGRYMWRGVYQGWFGFGFSVTEGMLVVFKKEENHKRCV